MMEINNDLLVRLDQKVQDLSERVERGFLDIKTSAISRIDTLESRMLNIEKKGEICKNDIEGLQNYYKLVVGIGVFVLVLEFGLLLWHVTGYHI